jgi:AP-1 complex subunit beta-1
VDEEAKVSLVWMLGEFCDFIESGPEILRGFIDQLLMHEQSVQLAILSAVVKMFLRNPEGMESTVNSVLEGLTAHSQDPDVRDRAVAYWRLLSKGIGVERMKSIVHGHKPPINVDKSFSDAMTSQEICSSINTAAAVYWKPYRSFLPAYGVVDPDVEPSEDEEEEGETPSTPHTPQPTNSSSLAIGPNPVQPEKKADPLADLFSEDPPVVPMASPKTIAQAGPSPFDDIFGVASTVAPQPPPQRAQLPVVLTTAQTGGIAIYSKLTAGLAPCIAFCIENQSGSSLGGFALQINTNSFGFAPAKTIEECMSLTTIPPMQSAHGDLPLRISDNHFNRDRHIIEVGIKSPLGLHRFVLSLNVTEVLQTPPPEMDPGRFAQTWRALDDSCEAKVLLASSSIFMANVTNTVAILKSAGFNVVVERSLADRRSYYAAVQLRLGITCLIEIIVFSGTNASQSYVSAKCQRVNDAVPTIIYVLQGLFPPSTPLQVGPGSSNSSPNTRGAIDDLFG